MKIETSILSKYCYERIVSIPHIVICFKGVLSVLKLTVNCQDVKLHLIVLKLKPQNKFEQINSMNFIWILIALTSEMLYGDLSSLFRVRSPLSPHPSFSNDFYYKNSTFSLNLNFVKFDENFTFPPNLSFFCMWSLFLLHFLVWKNK